MMSNEDIKKQIRQLEDSNLITEFLMHLQKNGVFLCSNGLDGDLQIFNGNKIIEFKDEFIEGVS